MSGIISLQQSVQFANNPEPRCPCVLLLDTSSSMRGEPIEQLNRGLHCFRDDLTQDLPSSQRVEVAVITFGGEPRVVQDFVTVDAFDPPVLEASGITPMGTAILMALDMLEERKQVYRQSGIDYYRPWCFMITDGRPEHESSDLIEQAASRITTEEAARRLCFFAVGVRGADMPQLERVAMRKPVLLQGLDFMDLFVWLSRSMQAVSQSQLRTQVPLPPAGWVSA